jgi:methyl coenzyme M reductase subunit D
MGAVEKASSVIAQSVVKLTARVESIDARLVGLEERVARIEERVEQMDSGSVGSPMD